MSSRLEENSYQHKSTLPVAAPDRLPRAVLPSASLRASPARPGCRMIGPHGLMHGVPSTGRRASSSPVARYPVGHSPSPSSPRRPPFPSLPQVIRPPRCGLRPSALPIAVSGRPPCPSPSQAVRPSRRRLRSSALLVASRRPRSPSPQGARAPRRLKRPRSLSPQTSALSFVALGHPRSPS